MPVSVSAVHAMFSTCPPADAVMLYKSSAVKRDLSGWKM